MSRVRRYSRSGPTAGHPRSPTGLSPPAVTRSSGLRLKGVRAARRLPPPPAHSFNPPQASPAGYSARGVWAPPRSLAVSDPGISEWGNPPGARPGTYGATRERAPGELKHLSTPRNREDSLSSGERTGRSPNPAGAIACRRCLRGVERVGWRGRQPPRGADTFEPKTAGTGHRRG